ncbi:uncharacterized PE-PGRS family protein PE_PGRS54-like isoform X2 [Equus asinus]|uniref:uncharacterized PE-PGRS family protein PE_PGRS54-like isoform X2 n=1 Tax=Equus asinus TaxID=9793 RepID=UPI0038F60193
MVIAPLVPPTPNPVRFYYLLGEAFREAGNVSTRELRGSGRKGAQRLGGQGRLPGGSGEAGGEAGGRGRGPGGGGQPVRVRARGCGFPAAEGAWRCGPARRSRPPGRREERRGAARRGARAAAAPATSGRQRRREEVSGAGAAGRNNSSHLYWKSLC